jgi:hypothetical protein
MNPIVCSYVPRCPRPGAEIRPAEEPSSYRLWAKQIAEAEETPYIDLYGLIWAEYAKLTPETTKERYFTAADFTHTSVTGAELNADKVAEGIRALPNHPLAAYLGRPNGLNLMSPK